MLKIEKVIYNNPATIVVWNDGIKTVVKCRDGDTYDEKTGFFLCMVKRLFGNTGRYNVELDKWYWSEDSQRHYGNLLKYDEDSAFHNLDTRDEIIYELCKLPLDEMIGVANALNRWELPDMLADILNIPNYLRAYFIHLPEEVKARTITPLISIAYKVIGANIAQGTEENLNYKGVKWEDWASEHKNMGR